MQLISASRPRRVMTVAAACAVALALGSVPADAYWGPDNGAYQRVGSSALPHTLVSGLGSTVGSTLGPDGALYVADGVGGRIMRVDPHTGADSVFADGLPTQLIPGLGGPMDIAFRDGRAYALVTLVSPDVGGTHVDGIYRIDGQHASTVVADIGAFAVAHPPQTEYAVPSGLQFALQPYRDGFLVTDGHHNRVYRVGLDSTVTEVETFGDIVPTGIMRWGNRILMTVAGPVPHLPATGQLVQLDLSAGDADVIATGTRLAVDVARAGSDLYTLSQGVFPPGGGAGSPADPGTGALMRVHRDGTVSTVAAHLDRPTSVQTIGETAFVVTLGGDVLTIDLDQH